MKAWQRQFITFALEKQVLRFGDFTLKSGRKSPYFFNSGLFNTGASLASMGRFYAQAFVESGMECDLLFGPAYKGIPLVAATAIALADQHGIDMPYCFNRKESKTHGEGGILVGSDVQGKIVLVDDVITAGTAIRESMAIIRSHRASLAAVLISLDRQEYLASGELTLEVVEREYGCRVIPLIQLQDLLAYLEDLPDMSEHLLAMRSYQKSNWDCAQ